MQEDGVRDLASLPAITAETRDFVLWIGQARKHRLTEPTLQGSS